MSLVFIYQRFLLTWKKKNVGFVKMLHWKHDFYYAWRFAMHIYTSRSFIKKIMRNVSLQLYYFRLISQLEERVELVSVEISNLEGVDRKANLLTDRYKTKLGIFNPKKIPKLAYFVSSNFYSYYFLIIWHLKFEINLFKKKKCFFFSIFRTLDPVPLTFPNPKHCFNYLLPLESDVYIHYIYSTLMCIYILYIF